MEGSKEGKNFRDKTGSTRNSGTSEREEQEKGRPKRHNKDETTIITNGTRMKTIIKRTNKEE